MNGSLREFRVSWENRAGTVGGNDTFHARNPRQARRVIRRRHGLTVRITGVKELP